MTHPISNNPISNHPIYTAGYALRQPDELLVQVNNHKAKIVDIRLHASPAKPGWNKEELVARFGSLYRHVPALGNLGRFHEKDLHDREGGRVHIANMKWGLSIVEKEAQDGPVILLCGCASVEACHRSVIADALRERGHTVNELGPFYKLRAMPLPVFAESGQWTAVYSDVLGCEIVLAADNASLPDAETRTVYRARELTGLTEWTADGLRLLHETKTAFGGEIVPDNGKWLVEPTASMFEDDAVLVDTGMGADRWAA